LRSFGVSLTKQVDPDLTPPRQRLEDVRENTTHDSGESEAQQQLALLSPYCVPESVHKTPRLVAGLLFV
jgi:hypothetical protein